MNAEPLSLYPFQREGVRLIHANDGVVLLCDEMGLGKTVQVLTYLRESKSWPALVVCPAPLKENWRREARRWAGVDALVLRGQHPDVGVAGMRAARLCVINYDVLWHWLPLLQAVNFQSVTADEGHALGSLTGRNANCFRALAERVPKKQILTGTPVVNYPAELYGVVSVLWPDEFDSVYEFMSRYCEAGEGRGPRTKWTGARNLAELNRRLLDCGMIRRRVDEVLRDLPPRRRSVVPVEVEDIREYERAERDFLGWLSTWDAGKVSGAMRAQQFARFTHMKRFVAELKLPQVLDWLDAWESGGGGKAIGYGIHRREKPFTVKVLGERPGWLTFHGGMSEAQKQEAVDAFMRDDSVRGLGAQLRSGGVGLNLQAAHLVAHVEFAWNHVLHAQATARAHRIGVDHPVEEVFFPAVGTLEEQLCEIIQRKQKISDRLIDGASETAGGLYILDELTEALLKKGKA